ncbi:GNAT family N-acetyltransferase [Streptomyces sp. NBC_00378]|uniref:GNAT family N-acetyltransferase n=1 Tax=unclassified Streptomyces TaxID=2593676 RepID=UPI0022525ED2|nr:MULTISPECIES: GNAT family N-acetyltransferase [unclassified Streptomyces]MCX5108757.1 GNAT family N-acetyltransferase [Streptomyces sp. NBC_00378]
MDAICDLQPLWTDRLTLRLFAENDLDDMYAYQGLPEVARYLYRPPRDRALCVEVIERIGQGTPWKEDGDSLTLAVCRRDAPGVIGEVMVSLSAAHAGQAEIGWVFHPGHGGRGYATEAALALRDLAFQQLSVHRLFARVDAENTASVRICERLSMRREAHLIENDRDDRGWGSEYVYAILAREVEPASGPARTGILDEKG